MKAQFPPKNQEIDGIVYLTMCNANQHRIRYTHTFAITLVNKCGSFTLFLCHSILFWNCLR